MGSICIDAIFREVLALIWQRSLSSYCQASSDKTFELRRDCKYLSNSRRSKNITLKHWTWRLFLLQINSFTARNWRQREQVLEVERFFFIVLHYFLTCLFTKSISLPSPKAPLFRASNSFRFTWSKQRCEGVTRPFASSPKRPGKTPYRDKAKYFLDVFDRILTVPFADLTFIKMWFTKIINFLAESVPSIVVKKELFKKRERKVWQFVMNFRKTQRKRNVRKIKWKTPKNSLVRLGLEIIRRFEEPGFHWGPYVWNKLIGIKRKGANKDRSSKERWRIKRDV